MRAKSAVGVFLIGSVTSVGAVVGCSRTSAGTAGEGGSNAGAPTPAAAGSTAAGSRTPEDTNGTAAGQLGAPLLPTANTTSRMNAGPVTLGTPNGTGVTGTPIPGPLGGSIASPTPGSVSPGTTGLSVTTMYLPSIGSSIVVPSGTGLSAGMGAGATASTGGMVPLNPSGISSMPGAVNPGLQPTPGGNPFSPTSPGTTVTGSTSAGSTNHGGLAPLTTPPPLVPLPPLQRPTQPTTGQPAGGPTSDL